ncbi:MAG: LUD domain-containing protein [Actinobacteria bacterium]|nr:LUD domain-containing protein [Actinomycetota bacterium]
MSARDIVLERVRAALGPDPATPEVPRHYRRAGEADARGSVVRFADRVEEYRASVHTCTEGELGSLVRRLAADDAVFVAAPAIAAALGLPGDEPPLSDPELDAADVVVTGCACAIATTGTIVLDGGPESGRRAISLIPDHHICVVRAEQVLADVPDAIAALRDAADEGRPLTFVTGPSATSDIELERVEGVHGPRRLDVALVR